MLFNLIKNLICLRVFSSAYNFAVGAVIDFIRKHVSSYPAPLLLGHSWSLGFIILVYMVIQVITGFFMTMYYTASTELAWESVHVLIYREVNYGWLVWYLHSNGASFVFIFVYAHICRAIFYKAYFRKNTWFTGIVIFFILMLVAFTGYVLPWSQMSYWGVTVITNFFTTVPYIGDQITKWIWGGESVASFTLIRFYSIHYLSPFLLLGLVGLHILALHIDSSKEMKGLNKKEKINWYPVYFIKDVFVTGFVLVFTTLVILINPDIFSHPDTWVKACSTVTPKHIVPEWYFLPFYGMVKLIPNKLVGISCMALSIAILFIVPFADRSKEWSPLYEKPATFICWILIILDLVLLGWLGAKPAGIVEVGSLFAYLLTFGYFIMFIIIMPIVSSVENKKKVQ